MFNKLKVAVRRIEIPFLYSGILCRMSELLPYIQYESKMFYLSLENHVFKSTAMSSCKIMDHQLNMGYCQQSLPLEEVELQ